MAWLTIHAVPLTLGQTTISLLPWGFVIIPMAIFWRGVHWALKSARPQTGREYWTVALWATVFYELFMIVISLAAQMPGVTNSAFRAGLTGALLALSVSSAVVLTYAPRIDLVASRIPIAIRNSFRPVAVTFALLIALSSFFVTGALILHAKEFAALTGLMAPAGFDGLFMTILAVGYLPTMVMWSLAYLTGPGITLGAAGSITLFSAAPGPLPAFPLLALLPTSAPSWAKYLIVIPVLLGMVMFFLTHRPHWRPQGEGLVHSLSYILRGAELITFATSSLLLGVLVWLMMLMSAGSLGDELLAQVGPDAGRVAIWATGLSSLGTLIVLIVPRLVLTLIYSLGQRGRD